MLLETTESVQQLMSIPECCALLFCLGATNLRFYGELGRVAPLCLSFTVRDWGLCMALYSSSQSSFPHQNGIGHLTGKKGGNRNIWTRSCKLGDDVRSRYYWIFPLPWLLKESNWYQPPSSGTGNQLMLQLTSSPCVSNEAANHPTCQLPQKAGEPTLVSPSSYAVQKRPKVPIVSFVLNRGSCLRLMRASRAAGLGAELRGTISEKSQP